jgi:hypothetical protein
MFTVPLAVLFLGSAAFASTLCVQSTLDTYITNYAGLGNACSIGDKLFYNFGYSSSLNNAAPPTASDVQIAPDPGDGITRPGILFSVGGFLAFPGDILDATITYSVASVSGIALIQSYDLSIAGSHTAQPVGTGFGTVTESFSNNPSGTPLVTSVGPLAANVLSASQPFLPRVSSVNVTTAIHLESPEIFRPFDLVTISAIQEHFGELSSVPEPYSAGLIGTGLLLFGLRLRKQRSRGSTVRAGRYHASDKISQGCAVTAA